MALKLTGTFAGWKQHRCVGCGAFYRYRYSGSAAVVARSPERRQAKLQTVLDRLEAAALEWRACPQCGCYQPDMVAQRRRYWSGWTVFAVWQGVFWLTVTTVNGQVTVPPLTWIAMGYWLACAAVLVWTAGRNFNADPAKNRDKAAAFTSAGTLRLDVPGTMAASTPPPTGAHRQRTGTAFAVLLALSVGLPVLAEGTRRAAGWPLNSAFFPPIAGPGDSTTFYLPETIRCVAARWHGQAQARLLNAGELGVNQDKLPAASNAQDWNEKELLVNPGQPDSEMHPWVTFTLPADAALARRLVRVRLRVHTEFPQLTGAHGFGDYTFVTGQRNLTADVALTLAATGAGWKYESLWYGALAGSGVLLTLAVRSLWRNLRREGQSTQTEVVPSEGS